MAEENTQSKEGKDKKFFLWKLSIIVPLLATLWYILYANDSMTAIQEPKKREDKELRMIIIGESGSGKSATGNTILDKKVFNAALSGQSTIKIVKMGTAARFGFNLVVIDTPEFSKVENISFEISKCYGMTSPGLHAILLVMSIGRLHEDLATKLVKFLMYFGEDAKSYITVVFTFKRKLEQDDIDISKYISTLPSTLKDVLRSVNGRYVVMGYKGDKLDRDYEVYNLIKTINEKAFYNENYKKFEKFLHKQGNRSNDRQDIRRKIESGDIKGFPKVRVFAVKSFRKFDFLWRIVEYFQEIFRK